MSNLFYFVGGLFTTSFYFLYKKTNFFYTVLLETNHLYNKIKRIENVKFRINSIYKVKYDSNLFVNKGKQIYRRNYYNYFFDNFNVNKLDSDEKYIINYTKFNKEYIVICKIECLSNIKNEEKKIFNYKNIVMALDGNEDITNLLNKYGGINNDFNFNTINEKVRLKDIIKDNNQNIENQLTIIGSDGTVKILCTNDYLN